ncbi:MAG: D-alanyl-D-alanine carboxypeptidase [Thiotrichaceae bacterium]|nr:D-alanyl-D-alanine carboxypeptidase [Thiotrichaceae bacterium]
MPLLATALTLPPELGARSYLLIDFHSNNILVSKNAGKKIEPASITKLMTAYVIYKELAKGTIDKRDLVLISEKAWRKKGSRMFVEANKKVPMERLMSGLIIQSGNDAAIALAEHVAGTEGNFVQKMNEEAKRLGMNNTQFNNATGWPDKGKHYSTVEDIALLARAVIKEFPEHYKLYSQKEYSYNGIKQYNRNKLLWLDPTVDGIKTGHTESAGYCLVSSAKRDNMRLISVVVGANSAKERSDYSQQLMEYGYRAYETNKLYKSGAVLENVRVWKGSEKVLPIGILDDYYITVPKGTLANLEGSIEYISDADAPIKRGDVMGKLIIKEGEKVVLEHPVVALTDISGGGVWRKMTDGLQKVFH